MLYTTEVVGHDGSDTSADSGTLNVEYSGSGHIGVCVAWNNRERGVWSMALIFLNISVSMNERVQILTSLRLDMNKPYIKKWPEVT